MANAFFYSEEHSKFLENSNDAQRGSRQLRHRR